MSFINLMASDSWSELDIENRVQLLIRSRYQPQDELKAARLARKQSLTASEQEFITELDTWISTCLQQGQQSREDWQLLQQVMQAEAASRRLQQPEVVLELDQETQEPVNQELVLEDQVQRDLAEQTIASLSETAKQLYEARNPVVINSEPELEAELAQPELQTTVI